MRPADSAADPAAAAFAELSDGLLVLDAEDGILACNPAFLRGWDLLGVPLVRSLTFAENLEAAAAIGRAGNGAEVWLAHRRTAAEPARPCLLPLPGGIALQISETAIADGRRLIVCRDVTAERQRETALKDSEYRYRLLVETITEGLILLDRDQRIVFANPRFLSWYRSGDMALLGRPVEELTIPEARPRLNRLFSSALPRSIEIPLACADGSRRFALISAARLRGAGGAAPRGISRSSPTSPNSAAPASACAKARRGSGGSSPIPRSAFSPSTAAGGFSPPIPPSGRFPATGRATPVPARRRTACPRRHPPWPR